MTYTTYSDLTDHVSAYLGKDVSKYGASAVRGAIQLALSDLPTHHDWSYYQSMFRVVTAGTYTTGTVAYDATGGTYERMVTLTSGTWPTWAGSGVLKIGSIAYPVSSRKSATVLTLDDSAAPSTDIASGTAYTLYRDTYPLPDGFTAMGDPVDVANGIANLSYVPLDRIIRAGRSLEGPSRPRLYTVLGRPERDGGMALRLWPGPDAAYTLDFAYRRRPRALRVENHAVGTVTVTAAGLTVTGHATEFTSALVGTVIRTSGNSKPPTQTAGANPYQQERKVVSVESATALTVDSAWSDTQTRVAFQCSDPLDVDPGVMTNAFLQMCYKQVRMLTRMASLPEENAEFFRATAAARDADSRYFGTRGAGQSQPYPDIRNFPIVNGATA